MQSYEYLALPAPLRGQKVKGLKTPAERYAHELTTVLNDLSAEGWEYCRSECLPSEERKGFTGKMVVQNHLLIFRRPKAEVLAERMTQEEAPRVSVEPRQEFVAPPAIDSPSPDRPIHDNRREPMFAPRKDD
ncbi:DUF4177 domain-containing protein [Roseinatronobacter monicus]|uniref:DUF4177 domain-containing protein n=1 Tax=Roseinatronobacter monicus TaxID=393481 RepID=A0A543K9W1_9RHOB|nr:DUF4177 domain-containing protein [Roseinatronobacter monicus]TQM91881.1 hypothetical protein BD293_0458 [Roseinatronobacter monicus]